MIRFQPVVDFRPEKYGETDANICQTRTSIWEMEKLTFIFVGGEEINNNDKTFQLDVFGHFCDSRVNI